MDEVMNAVMAALIVQRLDFLFTHKKSVSLLARSHESLKTGRTKKVTKRHLHLFAAADMHQNEEPIRSEASDPDQSDSSDPHLCITVVLQYY